MIENSDFVFHFIWSNITNNNKKYVLKNILKQNNIEMIIMNSFLNFLNFESGKLTFKSHVQVISVADFYYLLISGGVYFMMKQSKVILTYS